MSSKHKAATTNQPPQRFCCIPGAQSVPLIWSYDGESGPEHWGELHPSMKTCQTGQFQSPIDIQTQNLQPGSQGALLVDYQEVDLVISFNGLTMQVDYPQGSTLSVQGKVFELLQFHLHTPSEHQFDSVPSAMEIHLVHIAEDGAVVVLAVMIDQGAENPALKPLYDHFPHEHVVAQKVPGQRINAADLLPKDRGYYQYTGSLTMPPCTEEVSWNVFKTSISVSESQLHQFDSILDHNCRPLQPLNGRVITDN